MIEDGERPIVSRWQGQRSEVQIQGGHCYELEKGKGMEKTQVIQGTISVNLYARADCENAHRVFNDTL